MVLAGCWTVPGAGPERSGHNPNEHGLTPANVANLEPDWTWQAEWETDKYVRDPVVSVAGVHVSVGHKLVTIDPATGTERWRTLLYDAGLAAQLPVSAGAPTFEDGTVFVPVSIYRNFAPGSGTHTYDALRGTDLGITARSANEVTVPRDHRLFGTYGEILGTGIGLTGYFVANRADPSQGWGANLSVITIGSGSTSPTSPVVGPALWYFADGATLYAYPFTEPAGCGYPVVGSTFRVCPPAWSKTFGPGLTRPSLSDDGEMLFAGDAGHLWAFHASTGGPMWSGPLPTSDAPSAPPSVDDTHVFVPTAGKLVAFARNGCGAAACNPQWSAETGGTVRHETAIAGGVVYTATTAGLLRAFPADGCGAATCAPLWEHDLATQVTGAPAVSNGRLFVGTADGRLISFAPTS